MSASTTKRSSGMPSSDRSGPKPTAHLDLPLTISDTAVLVGTHAITVQTESVVHPRARLDSLHGPVVVGRRCVVHERSQLGAAASPPSASASFSFLTSPLASPSLAASSLAALYRNAPTPVDVAAMTTARARDSLADEPGEAPVPSAHHGSEEEIGDDYEVARQRLEGDAELAGAQQQQQQQQQQQEARRRARRQVTGVVLGDYVTIDIGAVVESGGTEIREGTTVGINAHIGAGARIGKYCIISPFSRIAPGSILPDFTVVYSSGHCRIDSRGVSEMDRKVQTRQIEVLRRLIPSKPEKFK